MPHDRNGKLLEKGETVVLRGMVDLISDHPERCNLRLRVADPTRPDGYSLVHVDSCLVELEHPELLDRAPRMTLTSDRMPREFVAEDNEPAQADVDAAVARAAEAMPGGA